MNPLVIIWDVSDDIFTLGPITLRWYGASFALAFLIGLYIVKRIFKEEGVPERWLDIGFFYLVAGILLGARLGHVFFYEWDYYRDNLAEIPTELDPAWMATVFLGAVFLALLFSLIPAYRASRFEPVRALRYE